MKSRRNKPKEYYVGGLIQAGLGTAQVIHGEVQRRKAKKEFSRQAAMAPSLSTPEQYYENYKNAYDSTLAKMEADNINRAYASSLQALQGAGGRAVVGGLGAIEAGRQTGMNQMLGQERQARMAAGQALAGAQSEEQQYRIAQHQQDMAMVNQAYQAGTQNIGNAVSSMAENAMYSQLAKQMNGEEQTAFKDTILGKGAANFISAAKEVNLAQPFQQAGSFLKNKAVDYIQNGVGNFRMEQGGMVTEGKFDHDTNPIHLVQNGEKVGEATGGEYILNPKQAAAVAKESTYARKLFKKFAKNAKKGK
jgi:hypothetical protein